MEPSHSGIRERRLTDDWNQILSLVRDGKHLIVMRTTKYDPSGTYETGAIYTIHSIYDTREAMRNEFDNIHLPYDPDSNLFTYPIPHISIAQAMEPNPEEDKFPF